MKIEINAISKKFNQHWIIKNFSYTFSASKKYAIVGANGSGKSTLLKMIAGMITADKGSINYSKNEKPIAVDDFFSSIAIAAPYLDLPENLSIEELLKTHIILRPLSIDIPTLLNEVKIDKTKIIRELSSGMKQRLKLSLAIYSSAPILLLDEPTANFDDYWKNWYQQKIASIAPNTLVILCSNEKHEYENFDAIVELKML